jgi:hypothetical protein
MADEAKIFDPGLRVWKTTGSLTIGDRLGHFLARWGVNRYDRRVAPGLYALGRPNGDSPVFVSANYKLSFDALRSSLHGMDCYILVLDTKGINVWCAAGKGTFGTAELIYRIQETGLGSTVNHRTLILPQLSAPGVAAHEVQRCTGFSVEFGPIRSSDIKAYLKTGRAAPEMRRVRFTLRDRLVLIPMELVQALVPMLAAAIVLLLLGGFLAAAVAVAATLAGVVLFPILLPWLPTPNFSTKGLLLGLVVSAPFVALIVIGHPGAPQWQRAGWALSCALAMTSVTAFLALNFTGSTTFTSRSGVKREIFRYVPVMAWMFVGGVALAVGLAVLDALGWSSGAG